jgi:hypothetical protein
MALARTNARAIYLQWIVSLNKLWLTPPSLREERFCIKGERLVHRRLMGRGARRTVSPVWFVLALFSLLR